jgi:hypothetical protein
VFSGCFGVSATVSSLPAQAAMMAPASARAAMLRSLIVLFILLFVLVGSLLFYYSFIPIVVPQGGLASFFTRNEQMRPVLQLDDLHRRLLIIAFLHICVE